MMTGMKEGTRVFVALGAAIGLGAAIAASGSSLALRLADGVAPVGTLWVNAIRMTVIPLTVSRIITGVASAAEVKALGRMGGRALATFLLLLAGMVVVIVPIAPAIVALLPAVGWFYDVPLHAAQLAIIAFAALFLGFAAPGIPHGSFILLTPLVVAVGLPAQGVGLLIAVDAIPDGLRP